MDFFTSMSDVLQTLVIALGAGLGIWGGINLMEEYSSDNAASNKQFPSSSFGFERRRPFRVAFVAR